MVIVDSVRDKLEEYGLKIFNEHSVEDSEHVFYAEHMILFVDKSNESVGISFQACTRAEKVANISLILNELDCDLNIMEAFMYDEKSRCLTGDAAYELIKKVDNNTAIKNFVREQTYTQMLMSDDCGFEC